MENALRLVSVERGRDPRRYALIAFGGAGPLHAARMARSIGIPSVIVPNGAGVGSAIGLLEAEPRFDVTATGRRLAAGAAAARAAESPRAPEGVWGGVRGPPPRRGGGGGQAGLPGWRARRGVPLGGGGLNFSCPPPGGPRGEPPRGRARGG